jgi:hypothetical protein
MKLEDLIGWHSTMYGGHWTPRSSTETTEISCTGTESLDIDTAPYGSSFNTLPLAVIANHLRLLGWVVRPPGDTDELIDQMPADEASS